MSSELGPFGNWLKDVMDRRGLGNNDLAAAIGGNSGTVSRWRNNRRVPDPESCELIADALGIDADIVLVRAGHRKPRRPIEEYDAAEQVMDARRKMDEATSAFLTVTPRGTSTMSANLATDPRHDIVAQDMTAMAADERVHLVKILLDSLTPEQRAKALEEG